MNLGELLDELRHGILHDISDQVEGDTDQLWSDQRLIHYINEAEHRFARQSLVIRDGTPSEITTVQSVAFQKEYALHPSVFAVLSARCHGDHADLARSGHGVLDNYRMPNAYFFDPGFLSHLRPGKIRAFDTDEMVVPDDFGSMGGMSMRLYPPPDPVHIQTVQLRVVRLPQRRMKEMRDVPEIPVEHHLDMLEWAAYLALRIVDLDAGSPDRGNQFRASFEDHCLEAKKLVMRKLFSPLVFGFGRNAFSWEQN